MERIIIIVRDEVGVIARVTRVLADAGINIESLDTERAGEQGIITLTTDDTDTALRALAGAGFSAATDDSLVFRLPDKLGALARMAERFKAAGVNIRSFHILDRRAGQAVVALNAHDLEGARKLLDPRSIV